MASIFWEDFRRLHQIMEVPTATSSNFRHKIRVEKMADRRDSFKNWPTILSLLVSKKALNVYKKHGS